MCAQRRLSSALDPADFLHHRLRLPIYTIYEPRQQNECAPSEDSDQPGHPPSLIRVFAVRMKKPWVLSYPLGAQRRPWSDRADAQADLSLRWAHSHFVGFVMSRLYGSGKLGQVGRIVSKPKKVRGQNPVWKNILKWHWKWGQGHIILVICLQYVTYVNQCQITINIEKVQDQDSLLVKRRNDNHSHQDLWLRS